MSGDAAIAIVLKHAASQGPKNRPHQYRSTLKHASKPFVAMVRAQQDEGKSWDNLYALLSSNASGNQVVSIIRNVRFAESELASTKDTVDAVITKYGKPTREDAADSLRFLFFGYKDGQLLSGESECVGLSGNAARLARESRHNAEGWLSSFSGSIVANRGDNCSAAMVWYLGYAHLNGFYNDKVIASLGVAFFDAQRFLATSQRDVAAEKELEEKARNSPVTPTAKPKL